MELISVIVPVYKVENYIDRCINSIVKQLYTNLEIILADDGSPDLCPTICDEWASKDERIKVIHKANGGLSDARNAGIAAATGEYLGFVDSDDWIAPDMYGRLLKAIKEDGSDIAACSVQMRWEDNSQDMMLVQCDRCVLSRNEAQEELLKERKLKQPVWYKLYKKEIIHDIPFYKGKYHEDTFWSYQAIGNAEKVSIIDYVGYYYWQRSGSIMGEGYSLRRLDAMEAYCNRYEYFKDNFPELLDEALRAIWISCIYHGQMAQRYLNKREQKLAFERLEKIKHSYPIRNNNYTDEKISHKCWFCFARINLRMVCKLKNSIGIGL